MGTLHPGSGSLELPAFIRSNGGLDRLQARLVGGKPWRAAYGFRQKPAFFVATPHRGSSLELPGFIRSNRRLNRLQARLVGRKHWRAAYGFRQKPAFFVAMISNFVHKAAGRQCQASSREKAAPGWQ